MRVVKMIVLFLEGGEQPKYKVTQKIRNYPKAERESAINYVLKNGLVSIREDRKRVGTGRTPSYICLTEKGRDFVSGISKKPEHISVWG